VCDRDILECDIELGRAAEKIRPYPVRNGFTLCDELCGVELGDDRLEDFVSDGWENTLVVILAEVLRVLSVLVPVARSEYGHTW